MSDKNKVESTTKVEPWGKASGELNELIDTAQGAFKSGGLTVDPYTGQRVAPMSGLTQQGAYMMGNLGQQLPAGTWEALASNIDGTQMYRDFDQIRKTVGDSTKAQLASTFAGGGINSGLAQDTYSRAMGEALAGVEYGAYDNAKQRQMQALGLAPQLATTQQNLNRNAAAGKLAGGGMFDQYNQNLINADMQRWNETQMKDIDALSRYSALLTPLGGLGSSSTMTAPGDSPLKTIAGAGATGLGTYGALADIAAIGAGPLAIGGGILAGLASF